MSLEHINFYKTLHKTHLYVYVCMCIHMCMYTCVYLFIYNYIIICKGDKIIVIMDIIFIQTLF